jgi:hypothetical protein
MKYDTIFFRTKIAVGNNVLVLTEVVASATAACTLGDVPVGFGNMGGVLFNYLVS